MRRRVAALPEVSVASRKVVVELKPIGLPVDVAAKYIGVPETTMRDLIEKGKISPVRPNGKTMSVPVKRLDDYYRKLMRGEGE